MGLKVKIGTSRYQPVKNMPDTYDCYVEFRVMKDKKVIRKESFKGRLNFAKQDAKEILIKEMVESASKLASTTTVRSVLDQAIEEVQEQYSNLFVL